jgi:hypothetical protein
MSQIILKPKVLEKTLKNRDFDQNKMGEKVDHHQILPGQGGWEKKNSGRSRPF